MAMKDRIGRLEARNPAARDDEEEEVRAAACRRMSTEDLSVLSETLHHLEESGADEFTWDELLGELPEGERTAFEQAYARYQQAVEEARAGR
jgi:hypothetical protein